MKSSHKIAALLLGGAALAPAAAAISPMYADSLLIPQRAIIVSGNRDTLMGGQHVAVLYSREDLSFNDPSAPRFLFLDRLGTVALGIGGYVLGTTSYDINGAVPSNGFVTYNIPVPADPAMRQQLRGDISRTALFLKLVTHNNKLGHVSVYVQASFGGPNYAFKLKQAYATIGHVTAGLAHSTFVDASTQAPTIDSEGPSGEIADKNILVRYKTSSYHGWSGAVAVELPQASYTLAAQTAVIPQRVPDLPAYIQYAWGGGDNNHVRLSGILRQMTYRDLLSKRNRMVTGWGVHLSGESSLVGPLSTYAHVAYGRGIATYVNDLGGQGLDLIPDGPGRLKAPGTLAWTAGLTLKPAPAVMLSAAYSQSRLYDSAQLTTTAYRYAQYATVTAYYNIIRDMQVGAEYIWGRRIDRNDLSGHANRVQASVQYSF